MKASLALHNPATASSSRTPPHPHPQPDDDDIVFIPQSLNDSALYITTTLMLEDMNRFVQELKDCEQSEAERKLKEDLDRWIHDQKLAADIHNIPANNGKNTTTITTACTVRPRLRLRLRRLWLTHIRLYFKGLVREERVKGIVVNVAGARVAICDSKDNLILEVRKNVEAMVNSVVVSGEVAELQALNKALTLDLKRVTFFCDDYMLCQYVSQ